MVLVQRLSALAALLALALATPAAAQPAVGFQRLTMPDGAEARVEVAVWYPTRAAPSPHRLALFTQTVAVDAPVAGKELPLVVISHGNGGELSGHYDTAQALAKAGFVVAALTHTGDNSRDQSRGADMANRPRQLSLLIDYMTQAWAGPPCAGSIAMRCPSSHPVDKRRVGAFGFSSGGFTVLAAAGGRPDLSRVGPHCQEHPTFFDCALVRQHPDVLAQIPTWSGVKDRRIKAIVSAAPALGYTFGKAGLREVTVPVQLWRAEDDKVLPHPLYAEAVRLDLPRPPETHVVPKAGHFDFLAPCSEALAKEAPMICTSEPGFDRAAFHEAFDRDVVRFFRAHL